MHRWVLYNIVGLHNTKGTTINHLGGRGANKKKIRSEVRRKKKWTEGGPPPPEKNDGRRGAGKIKNVGGIFP